MSATRGSYRKFLGVEIALTGFSFLAAFFAAAQLYPRLSQFYEAIAALFPGPYTPTGFTIAYASAAFLIFFVVNSLLFLTNMRRL